MMGRMTARSIFRRKTGRGFFVCLVFCALVLFGGAEAYAYSGLEELADKRIGAKTGSVQAMQAEERFPEAEFYYFSTSADMAEALRRNKIDAFAEAEALIRFMAPDNPDLTWIDEGLSGDMKVGPVFPKTDRGKALCDEYSEFVRELKADGEYDEIMDAWFSGDEEKRMVPDLASLTGTNGTIRMAADPSLVPFVYIKYGKVVGIDVDIAIRFCQARGYQLEIVQMDFPGILPAVVTGKCDFAAGGIAYTAERAESVYYAEYTFVGRSVMVVLKESASDSAGKGFPASLKESIEKTFIRESRWRLLVQGFLTTFLITVLSLIFGTALGFLLYLACRNGNRPANILVSGCTWLVQGMPAVLLLMILYYIIFGKLGVGGLFVSVVAFTLIFGTGMYGMLCSGVAAVDPGQKEAAYALGYTDLQTFFRIILPQAAVHMIPSCKAGAVSLIKGTAVVGYITVQDLTRAGDMIRSLTYDAFFPLITVAVMYFFIAGIVKWLIGLIAKRLDRRNRKPQDILKGVAEKC